MAPLMLFLLQRTEPICQLDKVRKSMKRSRCVETDITLTTSTATEYLIITCGNKGWHCIMVAPALSLPYTHVYEKRSAPHILHLILNLKSATDNTWESGATRA